jgi:hypothetical protein
VKIWIELWFLFSLNELFSSYFSELGTKLRTFLFSCFTFTKTNKNKCTQHSTHTHIHKHTITRKFMHSSKSFRCVKNSKNISKRQSPLIFIGTLLYLITLLLFLLLLLLLLLRQRLNNVNKAYPATNEYMVEWVNFTQTNIFYQYQQQIKN